MFGSGALTITCPKEIIEEGNIVISYPNSLC